MDLKKFLNSITKQERESIASSSGTTVDYFWQLSGGHRKAGPLLAIKIEEVTSGKVSRHDLRPDIFGETTM